VDGRVFESLRLEVKLRLFNILLNLFESLPFTSRPATSYLDWAHSIDGTSEMRVLLTIRVVSPAYSGQLTAFMLKRT
jgi:hypothetical protein